MNSFQPYSELELWVGKNIAHNLKFVPADKLNWKAAPEAKSVLEIVQEIVGATQSLAKLLQEDFPATDGAGISSIETAQAAILKVTADYAKFIDGLDPQSLAGEIDFFGTKLPRLQVLSMPVVEAIHHHGQISFIQTLWGDKDSHFYQMGT